MEIKKQEIIAAIAGGWCQEKTKKTEMDCDLAFEILLKECE